jgi:DNA-binding response OmpR family regulator
MTLPSQGRVLIVEDSGQTSYFLAELVRAEGFEPVVRRSAADALTAFASTHPVAVFLDWVLPDRPGIDVCREIRAADRLVPILFISGRDDEATVSRGLDAGADDFVFKPVRPIELVARLDAHLRKARAAHQPVAAGDDGVAVLRFGDIEVDLSARVASVGGEAVSLGRLEFRVLEYLARNRGVAVSRERIMSAVYGDDADISTDRVDLVVRRLRQKLGEGPARAALLVAVPGYGYRLERTPH